MTSPERPPSVRPVDYKGEPLDAERGPGLGCFWTQLIALAVLVVLTPMTVVWGWPVEVSIVLLFATLILLLFAGQTVIFLLRLVAADRREGRRVPLAGSSPTVGELEDEVVAVPDADDAAAATPAPDADDAAAPDAPPAPRAAGAAATPAPDPDHAAAATPAPDADDAAVPDGPGTAAAGEPSADSGVRE